MPAYFAQGTYKARIVGQGFDESQFGWQFVLRIAVHDGTQERERTVWLSLTDDTGNKSEYADKSLEVLAFLGFSEDRLSVLDPQHPQHVSLVGREVEVYCSVKSKDGDTAERWYINTPRAGKALEPADQGKLKKLDALFARDLKASKAGKPAAKPQKQPPKQAPQPQYTEANEAFAEANASQFDDDCPF